MTNSERASYIRGLMDGMELDPNAKETKLFTAIVELLEDLSVSVEELEDGFDELSEQVDEVDEDLGSLEEEYYGIAADSCGCHHDHDHGCGCHSATFEAICPNCGETIELDDDMLDEDSIECPNCHETLEFDFDDDDDEEDEEFVEVEDIEDDEDKE